ncbi:MAG: biotin transporter BioY [Dictyoglomus sp.]|nr:biotin transporter BioY [Dictyoglomus sp.]MCX7941570.1 biotin transporter BioY [Dictyoglomaceae bacterium]MDW8187811.1 biotin transporter BioY [Dictyoglomus sp.]
MNARKISLCAMGIVFMIIGSYLSINLPFTRVPFTLQVFFLFIIGLLFNPKESFFIILGYLVLGMIGFPVFAGGKGGINVLFGPTGGYLWGFLIASPIISFISKKGEKMKILGIVLGLLIIYLLGSIWLMYSLKINYSKALSLGVFPFIPFDLIKGILAIIISKYLTKFKIETLL